ncbi:hypothetical protein B0H13DRAFT_1864687 [Mycena leptocephala]|nr:hypothetical protein B0H13DRAFT_1864687 [Mycena leptocephala]
MPLRVPLPFRAPYYRILTENRRLQSTATQGAKCFDLLWTSLSALRTSSDALPPSQRCRWHRHFHLRNFPSDPGDDINTASDSAYGQDPDAPLPPLDELQDDPPAPEYSEYPDVSAEREAGILINDDDEVRECKEILADMDLSSDDGNWGIDHYCQLFSSLLSTL